MEPLTYKNYSIKDSFSFCEELRNLIMASFDVELLFTKIPLQETIDLCVQKLFEGKRYIDGLSNDSLRETATMTEPFSLFDNEYCRQQSLLNCVPSRLCTLPIIDTRLRAYVSYPSLIRALCACAPRLFCLVLCCFNCKVRLKT